jgi:hypothetical protein
LAGYALFFFPYYSNRTFTGEAAYTPICELSYTFAVTLGTLLHSIRAASTYPFASATWTLNKLY